MKNDLSYIRRKGFEVLKKELGTAGMVQFINQFESGQGDYTKERHKILKDISIDDIISSIAERKKRQKAKRQ
ncbi:MAG: hypothetical protein LBT79_01165 [Elusimicrobiota bacterium]|jgi:hypothetical protein|nr:hypothetical protein [Elusimicrobiota bacterium]